MSWWVQSMYSPLEVMAAILLAALPMSRISELALGVFERKTGIKIKKEDTNERN